MKDSQALVKGVGIEIEGRKEEKRIKKEPRRDGGEGEHKSQRGEMSVGGPKRKKKEEEEEREKRRRKRRRRREEENKRGGEGKRRASWVSQRDERERMWVRLG